MNYEHQSMIIINMDLFLANIINIISMMLVNGT